MAGGTCGNSEWCGARSLWDGRRGLLGCEAFQSGRRLLHTWRDIGRRRGDGGSQVRAARQYPLGWRYPSWQEVGWLGRARAGCASGCARNKSGWWCWGGRVKGSYRGRPGHRARPGSPAGECIGAGAAGATRQAKGPSTAGRVCRSASEAAKAGGGAGNVRALPPRRIPAGGRKCSHRSMCGVAASHSGISRPKECMPGSPGGKCGKCGPGIHAHWKRRMYARESRSRRVASTGH